MSSIFLYSVKKIGACYVAAAEQMLCLGGIYGP